MRERLQKQITFMTLQGLPQAQIAYEILTKQHVSTTECSYLEQWLLDDLLLALLYRNKHRGCRYWPELDKSLGQMDQMSFTARGDDNKALLVELFAESFTARRSK